jgi:small GTP-binding protein
MSGDEVKIKKKLCLLGDGAVGKTSLIRRYVFDRFDDKYITTIGTKVTKKNIDGKYLDTGKKIVLTLMIWDILGQRGIQQLHNMYYQNAKAALMVCDFTRKSTLENLNLWKDELLKITGKIPIIVMVNKIDLESQAELKVSEVEALSKDWNANFFLTSAKTGQNVENAFDKIGNILLEEEGAE